MRPNLTLYIFQHKHVVLFVILESNLFNVTGVPKVDVVLLHCRPVDFTMRRPGKIKGGQGVAKDNQ